MTASIPIDTYILTLTDGTEVSVDAMSYREVDPWFVFDDTEGPVLTIRIDVIKSIARGKQASTQTVDELTDPIDPKDLT